jgi:hypothetical protein
MPPRRRTKWPDKKNTREGIMREAEGGKGGCTRRIGEKKKEAAPKGGKTENT